jgi:hypothetical protein
MSVLGVSENGVFYYGARIRPKIVPPEVEQEEYEPTPNYDADAPEIFNARRFFGFTEYEPIDIILLRSRRSQRKGMTMTDHYFKVLEAELK